MAINRNNMLIAPATVQIDSVSIGGTIGESSFTHTIESIDIMANQSMLVTKSVKSGESGKLSFGMLEMTRENLKVIFETSIPIVTAGSDKLLYVGGDQTISEHEIIMWSRGQGVSDTVRSGGVLRKLTFWKCIREGDVEYTMSKEAVTFLKLTYKMIGDLTRDEGMQLFQINDNTAAAYDLTYGL